MLADDRRAVGGDLGPREPGAGHAWDLGEERVVAAGGLGAALDDVACYHGAGQGVPVVAGPAVVPGRRAAHHRGVGGPTGDDDVGAPLQGLDDPPAAEVGVGADEGVLVHQGRSGVHVSQVHPGSHQVVEAVQQVVAVDIGHGGGQA